MIKNDLKLRSYEKGDEKAQADIFNKVIVEMDPETVLIKPEKVRKRHQEPNFNPEQVKYLVNQDGKIVGYTECRVSDGFHGIFYPLILKEYRSKETLDQLFSAIYDFAKNNNPQTIESHYVYNLNYAHEYFKKQSIAKIVETREVKDMSIDIDEISTDVPGYEVKPLTREDFPSLIAFRQSKKSIVGDELTVEILKDRFEKGEMSPENSFLIYKDGKLVGYVRVDKYSPADNGEEDTSVYGTLNGMILDMEFSDGINLRKAMLKAAQGYYKKHDAKKLRSGILASSPSVEIYKQIGFEISDNQGSFHYVYEK
ncbi:MAG: hypothetical protein ACXAEU_16965 [Candidatus Hodarchaeales archaeon]|jgi:hypothetical protein